MSDLYAQLAVPTSLLASGGPAPGGVIYQSRHEQPGHAHTPGVRCPALDCWWARPVYSASAAAVADARAVADEALGRAARAEERARRADVRMGWVLCLAVLAVAVAGFAAVGVLIAFGGLT